MRGSTVIRPLAVLTILLAIAAAVAHRPAPADGEENQASGASVVIRLPREAGDGPGREVSVLVDERHLKLALVTLREGTPLPAHSVPEPTTIQVLHGEGVIHIGDEAVQVSEGSLVTLAASTAHDVVPGPGGDMLLLVHYLRGGSGAPMPSDRRH